MNTIPSSELTRLKVGIFVVLGLAMTVALTIWVNHRPYWWKPCQVVHISVEDATGLKTKSPVRSLGIEIGFLRSVMLTERRVILGICITAPIEILPSTRAYIRGEGFLGDKFVELKPVKYIGPQSLHVPENHILQRAERVFLEKLSSFWVTQAWADETMPHPAERSPEIPVGEETQDIGRLVKQVHSLVEELSMTAKHLNKAFNPEQIHQLLQQLNQTMETTSRTLSPQGGLTQTAQRTLGKLEDSATQLKDLVSRINHGEGSLGMLLNDPLYAQEVEQILRRANQLLNRWEGFRFHVDLGAVQVTGYNGGRGWFQLGIWPKNDRYYLLGISTDPRGRLTNTTTTTTVGGITQITQTQINEQTGLLLTGMLGKVFFRRLDISVGALYGDGAGSIALRLGPTEAEGRLQFRGDLYFRTAATALDARLSFQAEPLSHVYLWGGLESLKQYAGTQKNVYFFGAGLRFDDEDIKVLFALK